MAKTDLRCASGGRFHLGCALDEIITQNAGEALQNGALADGQAFAMQVRFHVLQWSLFISCTTYDSCLHLQGSPSEADQLDEDYDSDFESYSDDFESDNDEEKVTYQRSAYCAFDTSKLAGGI